MNSSSCWLGAHLATVLLACLVAGCAGAQELYPLAQGGQRNLLANRGFEQRAGDRLVAWKRYEGGYALMIQSVLVTATPVADWKPSATSEFTATP